MNDWQISKWVRGSASLGEWGEIRVSGRTSATLYLRRGSIPLPQDLAEKITAGAVIVARDIGRLLWLPRLWTHIYCWDLMTGELAYPRIRIPRDQDEGLRSAEQRILHGPGVVYFTECGLYAFGADCCLSWKREEDFMGFAVDRVDGGAVVMSRGGVMGRRLEELTFALTDGELLRKSVGAGLPSVERTFPVPWVSQRFD